MNCKKKHEYLFIKLFFLCFFLSHVNFISGQQAERKVTGTVFNEDDEPLIGVSVVIKGTSSGVITDLNGRFSLTISDEKATLVFSYLGFEKTEQLVTFNEPMHIKLREDGKVLSDVVVVGYGTQRKETVTGAINSIDTKEILRVPTSNLSTAITGKLPGLVSIQQSGRPGEDVATLFIRGQSTWVNTNPLVIVDGVERESFSQIDPHEVESISILKDASSTAVYGVRGANGVILISTKRGETGKPNINMSANVGFQKPGKIPKFLGSYDHLILRKIATINDGKDPANDPYLSDASIEGYRLGENPYLYPSINWYEELLKPFSIQQRYNVNISGGTDAAKYFVSLGFFDQGGMFKYTNNPKKEYSSDTFYKQFNFRSNIDLKINNYQTLSANISGSSGVKNGFPNVENMMNGLISKLPYVHPMYNPDGSFAEVQGTGNPIVLLGETGYDKTRTTNYDIVGSLKNDLSFILKNLTFDIGLSFNSAMGTMKSYREYPSTYRYNPLKDDYEQIIEFAAFNYSGSTTTTSFKKIGLQLKLYHELEFNNSSLKSTLVYNQQNDQYYYSKPFVLKGYASRIEYELMRRYLAELNLGYNGSENFAPGHQYGFFPAISLGYIISEESFMQNLSDIISFMKLRGSMGLVGNDKIGGSRFLWQGLYTQIPPTNPNLQFFSFGTTNPSSLGGIYEERSENINLTWETALKRNIGLDIYLFKSGLFNASIDFFDEHRKNILMQARSLLYTTGISSPQYNIGEVKNWGYELELAHRNKINQLGYAIKANYSFARNIILNYDDPKGTPEYQKYEGNRIGQYRGYQVLGFFQSIDEINSSANQATLGGPVIPGDLKYLDYNNDNQIDERDKIPIGFSNVPEIYYSVIPEISWRGFTLSAMLQGAANSSIFFTANAGFEFGGAYGGGQVTPIHQQYWTPENQDATYPSLHLNPQHSNKNINSFNLKSANYLRIRNIQLSYSLPTSFCNTFGINAAIVSISGNNIYTWSHLDNFDPETIKDTGGVYPQQQLLNFGLNINL